MNVLVLPLGYVGTYIMASPAPILCIGEATSSLVVSSKGLSKAENGRTVFPTMYISGSSLLDVVLG